MVPVQTSQGESATEALFPEARQPLEASVVMMEMSVVLVLEHTVDLELSLSGGPDFLEKGFSAISQTEGSMNFMGEGS